MNTDLDAIEGGAGFVTGPSTLSPRQRLCIEVLAERAKQDTKWGEQNHDSVHKGATGLIANAKQARAFCDRMFMEKTMAWEDIAVEELAEAIDAKNDAERRGELVQLAAVVVAWIECIDRRTKRDAQAVKEMLDDMSGVSGEDGQP